VGRKRRQESNEDTFLEHSRHKQWGEEKKQLGEIMVKQQVDVVCLQETIKQRFTPRELASFARG
jgi:mRNA deadenylase 3'-5' endonuclease subunit Ccr4